MQTLSGIDAAVLGILSPLIIADVTAGSGRYNLAQGAVGMTTGIGAALSTTAIGYFAQAFGFTAGLLVLAGVAAAGFFFIVMLLRESCPRDLDEATDTISLVRRDPGRPSETGRN